MTVQYHFQIFVICFFITACLYSIIASFTKFIFKNRPTGKLSRNQLKVVQEDATLEQRLELFGQTFFLSIFTGPVYLGALFLYAITIVAKFFIL